MFSAKICSSHFRDDDYKRDFANEILNLPIRKLLKNDVVPTLNLATTNNNPRKRQSVENRSAFATKRARKEAVEERKEIVNALLQEDSKIMKDAEVQVTDKGN